MNKKKLFLPLLILAAGVAGFAALKATRPKPPEVPAQERVWKVATVTVAPQALSPTLSLTGTLESPELTKAAAVSLEARGTSGDSRRSWTWAWRTAMWARLGQPQKAGEMIRGLLTHNTLDNLFTTHPPFQIDGNLGITAGICEMFVQSHAGEISILPAVSPKWTNGSVSGLKARDGFEVGAVWKDGTFTSAEIRSLSGNPAVIRIQGAPQDVLFKVKDGAELRIQPDQDGLFRFPTEAGTLYQLIR
jgi:alpha-L-fucosidase 2